MAIRKTKKEVCCLPQPFSESFEFLCYEMSTNDKSPHINIKMMEQGTLSKCKGIVWEACIKREEKTIKIGMQAMESNDSQKFYVSPFPGIPSWLEAFTIERTINHEYSAAGKRKIVSKIMSEKELKHRLVDEGVI